MFTSLPFFFSPYKKPKENKEYEIVSGRNSPPPFKFSNLERRSPFFPPPLFLRPRPGTMRMIAITSEIGPFSLFLFFIDFLPLVSFSLSARFLSIGNQEIPRAPPPPRWERGLAGLFSPPPYPRTVVVVMMYDDHTSSSTSLFPFFPSFFAPSLVSSPAGSFSPPRSRRL